MLTRNATCGFRSEILGENGWGQGGGKHSFVCKPTLFHFSNLNWNLKAKVWTNDRLQKVKIQSNEMEEDSLLLWWGSHSVKVFIVWGGKRIYFVKRKLLCWGTYSEKEANQKRLFRTLLSEMMRKNKRKNMRKGRKIVNRTQTCRLTGSFGTRLHSASWSSVCSKLGLCPAKLHTILFFFREICQFLILCFEENAKRGCEAKIHSH